MRGRVYTPAQFVEENKGKEINPKEYQTAKEELKEEKKEDNSEQS